MNRFLNGAKKIQNFTYTENGAGALKSTGNACVDAFGSLGAMRTSDESTIIETFKAAFAENREYAMKMVFYMRDIRGGQGARRVFRVIMKWLAERHPEYVIMNLDNFLFYGRGDDLLVLLDTSVRPKVIAYIKETLKNDWQNCKAGKETSLLAKWLPSENTSSKETKRLARIVRTGLGWTPKQYRVCLSALRAHIQIVEKYMSAKKWTKINYATVPAKASINYAKAFQRHDEQGYIKYLIDVGLGKAKVNAASLFPVDIIHKVWHEKMTATNEVLYDAMWKALPNYLKNEEETGICVVDTSGSMSGLPMEVAVSLGMYCADKCHGPFQNHFITFSSVPCLQEIKGRTIVEKFDSIRRADWGFNTDLEAVFNLILNTAKENNLSNADLPTKLYIISDMQFDEATASYEGNYYWNCRRAKPKTFMDAMEAKYAAAGYTMPSIVYWNVRASKCGMFQSTFQGHNSCMVSGYSPSLFKSIIEGTTYEEVEVSVSDAQIYSATREFPQMKTATTLRQVVDPVAVMKAAILNERYDRVWVG